MKGHCLDRNIYFVFPLVVLLVAVAIDGYPMNCIDSCIHMYKVPDARCKCSVNGKKFKPLQKISGNVQNNNFPIPSASTPYNIENYEKVNFKIPSHSYSGTLQTGNSIPANAVSNIDLKNIVIPLHLDIQGKDTKNIALGIPVGILKKLHLTEADLSNCLDLHINYQLIENKTLTLIDGITIETNDIIEEIRKKCKKTTNFMEENVKNIKLSQQRSKKITGGGLRMNNNIIQFSSGIYETNRHPISNIFSMKIFTENDETEEGDGSKKADESLWKKTKKHSTTRPVTSVIDDITQDISETTNAKFDITSLDTVTRSGKNEYKLEPNRSYTTDSEFQSSTQTYFTDNESSETTGTISGEAVFESEYSNGHTNDSVDIDGLTYATYDTEETTPSNFVNLDTTTSSTEIITQNVKDTTLYYDTTAETKISLKDSTVTDNLNTNYPKLTFTDTMYDLTTPSGEYNTESIEANHDNIATHITKSQENEESTISVENLLTNDNLENDQITESTTILTQDVEVTGADVRGVTNDDTFETTDSSIVYEDITTQPNANITLDAKTAPKRIQYHEGQYEIPKLITIEYPNGTVISFLDGYEELPNSDFVKPATLNKPETIINDRPIENDKSTSEPLAKCQNNSKNTNTVTGQLYLKFNDDYIPANFEQRNGILDIAVDGYSFCDEYKRSGNKSLFFYHLCNVAQKGIIDK